MRTPTSDVASLPVAALRAIRVRPVPGRPDRRPTGARVVTDATAGPSAHGAGSLTAVVDTRCARVRASGHLTVQGADLLRGTVETLRSLGHRRIVLDLTEVHGADPDGLDALDRLCRPTDRTGGDLVVRSAADRPAPS